MQREPAPRIEGGAAGQAGTSPDLETRIAVLLVEDDDQDARLLDALVARAGSEIQISMSRADSLEEARLQLEIDPCDVVLLDLGLPDSKGLETYLAFARAHPMVPVVVLSGSDDKERALAAVRHGAQDYLVKGHITGEGLLRVLHYSVERALITEERRRDAIRQSLLLEVGRVALESGDPDDLLQAAAPALAEGIGVPRTEILQATSSGLRWRAGTGREDRTGLDQVTVAFGNKSWEGFAVEQRRPIVVEDLTDEHRFELGALLEMAPPRSGLVIPIETGDVWGVLGAFADEPTTYSAGQVFFARQLAGLIGAAVTRWEVEHQRKERVKELTALRSVSRAVQQDLSKADLAAHIADALVVATQFPDDTVARVRLNGDTVVRQLGGGELVTDTVGADITVDGALRGRVEFGYTSPHPFLPEEQDLVDSIAETVSVWISRREVVTKLADSRRRMELLLTQLPAIVYTTDPDLLLTSVSGQQAVVLSDEPEQIVGTPIGQLMEEIPTDERAEVIVAHQSALKGDPSSYMLTGDGRVWVGTTEPLLGANGQIVGVIGLTVDDTERRQQQQALAASQARLQALFDHALDAILLADDDGRYLDANPAACQLTGYTRDELLNMRVTDLVADPPTILDSTWETFHGDGQQSGRVTLCRRDGERVVTEYRAAAGIQPDVHLSIMRDVTARLRAEGAVRASEQRFRELSERSSDGIYRLQLHPDLIFEYVNPALEQITGFGRYDILSDPWLLHRRTHADDRLDGHHDQAVPTEHRFQRRDGTWIWIELQEVLIRDEEGRPIAVHGLVRDVTTRLQQRQALEQALEQESRATEQLRRLDAMKDGFLQAVSHEFRTPLTTIFGNALTLQQYQDSLPPETAGALLDRLTANAQRLRELLDDFVDISSLTADAIDLGLSPMDLSELAAQALKRTEIPQTHTVELDLQTAFARVDPGKFERITSHLIANATRHTPPGTNIWVSTRDGDGGPCLVVSDDGPGVADDVKSKVFDLFVQGPETRGYANPGTGIGLNLVSKLAELQGGRAWVSDREGGGAAFHVMFRPPRGEDQGLSGGPSA